MRRSNLLGDRLIAVGLESGDSEVAYLWIRVMVQEDVQRLEVTMDNVQIVQVVHAVGNAHGDDGFVGWCKGWR